MVPELYKVEFKGSRREFFYNSYHHSLKVGDYVIVQGEQGEDIGTLSQKIGAEVDFTAAGSPRSILRPAGDDDLGRLDRIRADEKKYGQEVVIIIRRYGLAMKIVDVECHFDRSKITFYFTADHRVDFRSLVRELASKYHTRIELRQIGVRDEARRLDGYGICGRRQCCNCHIKEFAPISTQHARAQDLSLNPSKISGNCGRLLCCLRYEVDMYTAVKAKFPPVGTVINAVSGCGRINRIDIFREEAVFRNEDDEVCRAKPEEIIKGDRDETKPNMKPGGSPHSDQPRTDQPSTGSPHGGQPNGDKARHGKRSPDDPGAPDDPGSPGAPDDPGAEGSGSSRS